MTLAGEARMEDGNEFRFKRLDVYRLAAEHFEWICEVVRRMPRGPFKVTEQALGASLSIMGNLGEANGRDRQPREVQQHYRYALSSTFEAATHLDALAALGVIDDAEREAAEERLSRIAAMIRRLAQRQRRKARGAKRPRKKSAGPTKQWTTPASSPQPKFSTPRASGVPASPKGAAGIDRPAGPSARAKRAPEVDPSRSEVPPGIDPREAGRQGPAGAADRPSPRTKAQT